MEFRKRGFSGCLDSEPSERELEHRRLSRRAAAEGMVLLQNDGVLPLAPGSRAALYGMGARYTIPGGTGSGSVNSRETVSIDRGLRNAGIEITTDGWLKDFDEAYAHAREKWQAEILAAAKPGDYYSLYLAYSSRRLQAPEGKPFVKTDTDTAIYVISRVSGESVDRRAEAGDYYLSQVERRELEQLSKLYEKLIVVLNVGGLIGREMKELGVTLWLAPGMNIHRNPLCGRNFEYYSEDPVLSGVMAAAVTKGVQMYPGIGVTIKHFACNNQEDNRMGVSSVVSERALREIYLKGFEIAVKQAQPMAIMTSYNRINSVHTANSFDLCTTAARKEWGFGGMIMTDWVTTNQGHGSSAVKCIQAGNDLIMPGNESDILEILDALDAKKDLYLKEDDLDSCVTRILEAILSSDVCPRSAPYGQDLRKTELTSCR